MQTNRQGLAILLRTVPVLATMAWSGLLGFAAVAFRIRWSDVVFAEVVPLLLPAAFWILTAWSCRISSSRSMFWWSGVGAQAALVGLFGYAIQGDLLSVTLFLSGLPFSLGWILLAADSILRERPPRLEVSEFCSPARIPITHADDERS